MWAFSGESLALNVVWHRCLPDFIFELQILERDCFGSFCHDQGTGYEHNLDTTAVGRPWVLGGGLESDPVIRAAVLAGVSHRLVFLYLPKQRSPAFWQQGPVLL